jgi:hypothetical protein
MGSSLPGSIATQSALAQSMFSVSPEFGEGSGGSTRNPRPAINHDFGPAASHIRRSPRKAPRLSARIGPQAQREQIGKTEGSLDVEPVVRFQPDADRECCRGKAR